MLVLDGGTSNDFGQERRLEIRDFRQRLAGVGIGKIRSPLQSCKVNIPLDARNAKTTDEARTDMTTPLSKKKKVANFGSLASLRFKPHGFAPRPRDRFALSI